MGLSLNPHIDGLVQERRNSSALALELTSFFHLPIDIMYIDCRALRCIAIPVGNGELYS